MVGEYLNPVRLLFNNELCIISNESDSRPVNSSFNHDVVIAPPVGEMPSNLAENPDRNEFCRHTSQ